MHCVPNTSSEPIISPVFFNNTGIVLRGVGDRRHLILLLTGVAQVWDAQRHPLIIPAKITSHTHTQKKCIRHLKSLRGCVSVGVDEGRKV